MAQKQICDSARAAVADIPDGASLLVHSFGPPQAWPTDCLLALAERGVKDLTVICNTPAGGPTSLNILAEKEQIRKLICSYVGSPAIPSAISELVKAGAIELEMVPQGTLVERVRAGGAGLAGFFTPTGVGTPIAAGKEERVFEGKRYVFERALTADFALLQAYQADPAGNLTYRRGMRNFGPAFAMGAKTTIAEVKEIVPLGAIDPEAVATPGIFVDRIVQTTTQLDVGVLRQILMAYGRVTDMEGRTAGDGPVGLPADLMAMKTAALLHAGEYVNLGIGLPTLVTSPAATSPCIRRTASSATAHFRPKAKRTSISTTPAASSSARCRARPTSIRRCLLRWRAAAGSRRLFSARSRWRRTAISRTGARRRAAAASVARWIWPPEGPASSLCAITVNATARPSSSNISLIRPPPSDAYRPW